MVDEAEGRALNRDYRRKDYATNVLTFEYEGAPMVVADLVLCAPVIEREASAQRKSVEDHYAHLLVHGTLHAQGWDHRRRRRGQTHGGARNGAAGHARDRRPLRLSGCRPAIRPCQRECCSIASTAPLNAANVSMMSAVGMPAR